MILRDTIVEGLLDGKAKDVVCLDMKKLMDQYATILLLDMETQQIILKESIELYIKCIKNLKENLGKKGKGNSEWILMDYVSVIAHIFYKDTRSIYNLEELWRCTKKNTNLKIDK